MLRTFVQAGLSSKRFPNTRLELLDAAGGKRHGCLCAAQPTSPLHVAAAVPGTDNDSRAAAVSDGGVDGRGGGAQKCLLLIVAGVGGGRFAAGTLAPAQQQRGQCDRGEHQAQAAGSAEDDQFDNAAVVQALPQPSVCEGSREGGMGVDSRVSDVG